MRFSLENPGQQQQHGEDSPSINQWDARGGALMVFGKPRRPDDNLSALDSRYARVARFAMVFHLRFHWCIPGIYHT